MGFKNPRLREVTDAELVEARERADAGVRLAMPQFAESLGLLEQQGADGPKVNSELGDAVLGKVAEARAALTQAMRLADEMEDRLAHIALGEKRERLDDLERILEERWGE